MINRVNPFSTHETRFGVLGGPQAGEPERRSYKAFLERVALQEAANREGDSRLLAMLEERPALAHALGRRIPEDL